MSAPDYISLLDSALGNLLPAGIKSAVCPIPKVSHFRFPAEAHHMRMVGNYRKCEFLAGRECARAALKQIGFFPEAPILADAAGVPIWPEGSRASLSHSRGYCGAIAARSSQYQMLGLDLEKTNRMSRAAIERVVHSNEQSFVQKDQKKASLIFGAKEAFFKAQFPLWRTHANFRDLELAVDGDKSEMRIQGMGSRFPDELRSFAADIKFRFSYFKDFVVTACWLEQRD